MSSGRMPLPVSVTASRTSSLPRSTETVTAPPSGVNLIAFDSRLNSACLSRRPSASIAPISSGHSSLRLMFWWWAR